MITRASVALLILGLVVVLIAGGWSTSGPDANIGAGLLVFAGLGLMALGVVGSASAAVLHALHKRAPR